MERLSITEAPVVPYRYMTASGVVDPGPCILWHIIVTPDGSNASYADLYDGIDTSSPKIARIRTQAKASRPYSFGNPLYLPRGCYVDFETNLECVTINVETAEAFLARVLGWKKMRKLT